MPAHSVLLKSHCCCESGHWTARASACSAAQVPLLPWWGALGCPCQRMRCCSSLAAALKVGAGLSMPVHAVLFQPGCCLGGERWTVHASACSAVQPCGCLGGAPGPLTLCSPPKSWDQSTAADEEAGLLSGKHTGPVLVGSRCAGKHQTRRQCIRSVCVAPASASGWVQCVGDAACGVVSTIDLVFAVWRYQLQHAITRVTC
jgi:hypothetical protein